MGVACSLGLAAAVCACGGSSDSPTSDTLTISSVTPGPTQTPDPTGFAFPIEGACLPSGDQLMPGAPRPYRNGIHEGVDFYDSDNCTPIGVGTEVLAAKPGKVIRADWDYVDLTQADLDEIAAGIEAEGKCDENCLDRYRGRQVWIDHGGGLVTRYAHLSRIAEGIDVGVSVDQGQLIAYVGNSGTPESVSDPSAEMHLHFELRVGDTYLGEGLPPAEVRALYERAFGVQPEQGEGSDG